MNTHWGEIPSVPEADSGIIALEREQMTKPRSMEVEGPRLHQPSSRHYPPSNDPLPADHFQMDPVTLHTIQLIHHAKKMRPLIHSVQQQQIENKNSEGDITFPTAPSIPEFEGPEQKHQLQKPIPFMARDFNSDFAQGKGQPPPRIDEVTNRKLLRRSVAALCAHVGFDTCPESVLETLTDILNEYYLQMTKHLRAAADTAALNQYGGFPDIVEQVFHEMSIGSVTSLHDFYQTRVIAHHQNMQDTCRGLLAEYEKLKQKSKDSQPDTFHVIRIKDEPCAEIQFPTLDENDEVNEAEQLLQLEGFAAGFAITVEQETAEGLTTEVESKWSQAMAGKSDPNDAKVKTEDGYEEVGSVSETVTDQLSDDNDPGSIPVSDILSPPSITSKPSKPKKRKR
ncbi:STAGA complex 65 subunit gamma-like isoform X1 [Haliotis cracherodii]|uniref:STAGA complex 65 subunit gamma-like isoform X1 n=1 Tax=Haliotis rufescens TaxID=6454 RepID=UPI001EB02116|nr:STAGA complex 65 subunit gamma-like isoform X1 [Haliotis rufescens]XP_048243760.1 STAGA complex 65 subunit gamma-like isoform X2 [Haliotis rufescens]